MPDVVDSLLLDQASVDPPEVGSVWRDVGDNVKIRDGVGVLNLRDAVAGDQAKVSANDSTLGYLEDKIKSDDATILISVVNEGGNEHLSLTTDLAETFLAQEIESASPVSTTSAVAVDAFAGASLLVPSGGDGDWLVLFESDARMTNANIEGSIAVGKNGINEVAGSIRIFGGNQRGSAVVVKALPSLVAGDTIHGVYKKIMGLGSAELFNRSLTAFRIG